MTLRVVGAGLGRTGTLSLKLALERLLGAPCYHMMEVFANPEHVALWTAAARGEPVDWHALFRGYAAAVDWPVAAFWPEVSAVFPDATILHSLRDAQSWWRSASTTIFPATRDAEGEWRAMVDELSGRHFTPHLDDEAACIAAFERHNAEVRARAPAGRLLAWRASDGWEPLCAALGLEVPDEPFPRANSGDEFRAMHAARMAAAGRR
jgi:Sulfotransferase domain